MLDIIKLAIAIGATVTADFPDGSKVVFSGPAKRVGSAREPYASQLKSALHWKRVERKNPFDLTENNIVRVRKPRADRGKKRGPHKANQIKAAFARGQQVAK